MTYGKTNKTIIWSNRQENSRRLKIFNLTKEILNALNVKNSQIEIFLIGHSAMKKLKNKFLKSDRAASVLSFSYPRQFPHPETEKNPLGEIYFNRDYFKKKDWPVFLLHGILHLLGYTHAKRRDRIKMQALEDKLYKAVIKC